MDAAMLPARHVNTQFNMQFMLVPRLSVTKFSALIGILAGHVVHHPLSFPSMVVSLLSCDAVVQVTVLSVASEQSSSL